MVDCSSGTMLLQSCAEIDLPNFGVVAALASQGVLLHTNFAEYPIRFNSRDFHNAAAQRAADLLLGRSTLQCGNSGFQLSDTAGQAHEGFPSRLCLEELQHV